MPSSNLLTVVRVEAVLTLCGFTSFNSGRKIVEQAETGDGPINPYLRVPLAAILIPADTSDTGFIADILFPVLPVHSVRGWTEVAPAIV